MGKESLSQHRPRPSSEIHNLSNVQIKKHKEGMYLYEVKGIRDEMNDPVAMDMDILRLGDVNLLLRDTENREKPRSMINFSGSTTLVENMAVNLIRIPYELLEHQGRIVDNVPAPKVATRQRGRLKITHPNEINSGEVCGIMGDGNTRTLMDISLLGDGGVNVSLYPEENSSQKLTIKFKSALDGTKAPILSATFRKIAKDLING